MVKKRSQRRRRSTDQEGHANAIEARSVTAQLAEVVANFERQHKLPTSESSLLPPLEVSLHGYRLFQTPTGSSSSCVPESLQQHAWIKGKCFGALPTALMDQINKETRETWAKDVDWQLERHLSSICERLSQQVGFNKGRPLLFPLQNNATLHKITADAAAELGWSGFNPAKQQQLAKEYAKQRGWYNDMARGYAGWLTCQRSFCEERAGALANNLNVISLLPNKEADASGDELPGDARDFLVRWRLQSLAGPFLPVPLQPMLAGHFPLTMLRLMQDSGGLFFLPDTFPIPSRDELRKTLAEAVSTGANEHLKEWLAITASKNPAKNKITRFSRLLDVQRYWQILHDRHPQRMHGAIGKLQIALAKHLGVSQDSLKRDLRFLYGQLGDPWRR